MQWLWAGWLNPLFPSAQPCRKSVSCGFLKGSAIWNICGQSSIFFDLENFQRTGLLISSLFFAMVIGFAFAELSSVCHNFPINLVWFCFLNWPLSYLFIQLFAWQVHIHSLSFQIPEDLDCHPTSLPLATPTGCQWELNSEKPGKEMVVYNFATSVSFFSCF